VTTPFDPSLGLVVIGAEVEGPTGRVLLPLALDTGGTRTLIESDALTEIGYDPASSSEAVAVATASDIAHVPVVTLKSIRCLGQVRKGFAVLAHNLPPEAGVAGLLGLDFLRDHALTIHFPKGEVKLVRPRGVRTKSPRGRGGKRT
jgi:predicted aspartyl protease